MVLGVAGSSPVIHPKKKSQLIVGFFILMNYFVYILYSHSYNTFYKCQSTDISNTLINHHTQHEALTLSGSPWKLIWRAEKTSRKDALDLERKLKNLDRIRLIKFMLKYTEGIAGPDALTFLLQWSGC